MIIKILLAICISIASIAIMSMFLAGCTSDADKEYEECDDGYYHRAYSLERCPYCGQKIKWK